MPKHLFVFFSVILFVLPLSAQSKLSHWSEAPTRYAAAEIPASGTPLIDWSISNLIVVPYHILISDVDGDRCAFTPTCSAFFVDACRQTNFLQGTLMFVDRFTRDSNTLDRSLHYLLDVKRNRFIDPTRNYRLRDSLIIVGPQK